MSASSPHGLRLLLVDDDEQDRFLVKQALSEEFPGLESRDVLGADDLQQALSQGPYDLAITDYALGWSDGVSVSDAVHGRFPGCPIIMFSGTDLVSADLLPRFARANIADVVPKSGSDLSPLKEAARRVTRASLRPPEGLDLGQCHEFFSSVIRGVVDYAIFLLDEHGRVMTWNQGARRIKGYEPQEIIGKSFEVFYPPEEVAVAKPSILLEKARDIGHVEDEGWRVRRDGSRFWADVTITAVKDDSGKVIGFCKVTRDLTERRAGEERLRRSEERLRALVSSVQDYAIFMLDPEGRIMSWNKGAQRIKGYAAEEVLGKSISIFYPPEDKGGYRRLLNEAAQLGRVENEGWRVRRDGSRFWADVVITALRDEGGKLTGFAKVTRDLTQRKKTEEEMERRARALELLNRELDLFSATVSHDIKAPLRHMQAYATVLDKRPLDDGSKSYVRRMLAAIARLQGMTEDLLAYSRLARETLPLARVETEELVERLMEQHSSDIAERGAAVEVRRPIPPVVANQAALERAVGNLIGNALKFVAPGGSPAVAVRAETRGSRVRLLVEDRGIGVPEAVAPNIFKPFQRGHGRDTFPGHGLGLAIVRRAVERMRGSVGYDPREGGGSVFWIELEKA